MSSAVNIQGDYSEGDRISFVFAIYSTPVMIQNWVEVIPQKNTYYSIEASVVLEVEDCHDKGFTIITLWVFFNILTWYITHRAALLNHKVEMGRRLRTAIGHFQGGPH